jgi:hypothetical protein
MDTPTATDNCGTPTLTFTTVTTPGSCPNQYTLTRTWTATDACGNVTNASQVFNVVDTTPPVFLHYLHRPPFNVPEPQHGQPYSNR